MNNGNHDILIADIQHYLDKSVEDLPDDTLEKLHSARQLAVAQVKSSTTSAGTDESIALAARTSLDDATEELEPEVKRRLDAIRSQAVARLRHEQDNKNVNTEALWQKFNEFFRRQGFGLPAGGLVTACLLVTVVVLQWPDSARISPVDSDILLFASADEIELYENLEFYLWLAENGMSQ